jgi:hypothetical protein
VHPILFRMFKPIAGLTASLGHVLKEGYELLIMNMCTIVIYTRKTMV